MPINNCTGPCRRKASHREPQPATKASRGTEKAEFRMNVWMWAPDLQQSQASDPTPLEYNARLCGWGRHPPPRLRMKNRRAAVKREADKDGGLVQKRRHSIRERRHQCPSYGNHQNDDHGRFRRRRWNVGHDAPSRTAHGSGLSVPPPVPTASVGRE